VVWKQDVGPVLRNEDHNLEIRIIDEIELLEKNVGSEFRNEEHSLDEMSSYKPDVGSEFRNRDHTSPNR
jgi:hypothetical protein